LSEQEFIEQISNHQGIINKIIYLYIDDSQDRQDLRQEIQLQAWKAIGRFRGDSQFSTWLYRVALNTVLTFRRKNKINATDLDKVSHHLIIVDHEPSDRSELLFRAIKKLNDVDKAIITLHLEDYDNSEIAEITGLSKNNVGVKLHRIKQSLKEQLKKSAAWTN